MRHLNTAIRYGLFICVTLLATIFLFYHSGWAGTVSGTLFLSDGTTPLDQPVHVNIQQGDPCGHHDHVAGTVVDPATGMFTINGIPPGQYYIKMNNSDSEPTNAVERWWNSNGGAFLYECNQAELVTLTQGQDLTGLTFTTQTGANVSGTVYEYDGVTPIAGDWGVIAQRALDQRYMGGSHIASDGTFEIKGLPPGDYFIRAETSSTQHAVEFYNNAADAGDAEIITVTSGTETFTGIDFTLEYPIDVEITYIHNPDNTFTTGYGIYFFDLLDAQSVASISVIDPSGTQIHHYTRDEETPDNFEYIDRWTLFYFSVPGTLTQLGEYTFNIETDDFSTVVKRSKIINKAIPVVDAATMSPADNALIDDRFPVFQWGDVDNTPYPVFHRLKIFDHTGDRIYASGWEANLRSVTLTEGLLQPGQSYTWEVSIYDHNDWTKVENMSYSERFSFTMADTLSSAHSAMPAIDLDGWGAVSWRRDNTDATSMWIRVIDHDGIALDGSSHQVSVTFNGGTHPLYHVRSNAAFEAFYEYWDGNTPAPAGDYVFTVTDPDGNTATATDTLVVNPLPIFDPDTLGIIANGTSPTFTWDALPGAVRYRVRIYDMDWNTVWNGYPQTTPSPSCTVPPGILLPNTHYRYRIDAWDSHSLFDTDNVTASGNIPFTTGDESGTPFIEASNDAFVWSTSDRGTYLGFYTNIHDAQGVPDNISSVTAVFPDGTRIPLYLFEKESATSGIYYNEYFTLPFASGEYTIIVEDLDGHTHTHTDTLEVAPIGYPDAAAITATVSGTQVDMSWDPVTEAAFYQVELYDIDQNRIHRFVTTENTYTIPEGFLSENTFYRYRITAWREFFDQGVDNAGRSGLPDLKQSFVTAPDTGTAPPHIDLNGKGAFVNHATEPFAGQSICQLEFTVSATDLDGVPENIAHVRVTYPDGTTTQDLWLDGSPAPGAVTADFSFYETYESTQDIQEGVYTFAVTDQAGKQAVITDTLAVTPLAIPAGTLPADGAIVADETPVISWEPVPGADRYKIILYQDFNTRIHEADGLSDNAYTLPEGLLENGRDYNYIIYAYDEEEAEDLDNMSQTRWGLAGSFFRVDTEAKGSLSGTLLDDDGQPVENLKVEVWAAKCWNNFLGQAYTDAAGSYLIENLPPETVYVRTCAECDNQNFIDIWWDPADGTIDCGLAAPVTIAPGAQTRNIDMSLAAGPRRIYWTEINVRQGQLGAGFDILPGFNHLIASATLTGPNGFYYAFDLDSDVFSWRNECNYLVAWWHDFTELFEYGEYTFTITFRDGAQETASYDLQQVSVPAVETASMSHTVHADGSIDFAWTIPDPDQKYQVRIYQNGERIYRSSLMTGADSLQVNADSLRCVIPGGAAVWEVRTYDAGSPANAVEKSGQVPVNYTPAALENRSYWFEATKSQGSPDRLDLYFNIRPGSRDQVTKAVATGPEGFAYTFDLVDDWFDMSTETRTLRGWVKSFSPDTYPVRDGQYSLTVTFDDGHVETQRFTLEADDLTPVEATDMGHEIFENGAMRFFWELPPGVHGQNYQVRIRNRDGSKEFVRSGSGTDITEMRLSPWDLRGLPQGEQFIWFVRAHDPQWDTRVQSDSRVFTYNPFDIDISGKVSLISPSGTILDRTPALTWHTDPASTWYYVFVQNADKSFKYTQWYETTDNSPKFPEAECSGGICSVNLHPDLALGTYEFFVMGWNDNGNGAWSDGMTFTIADNTPAKIQLNAPSGQIDGISPEFTWKQDGAATWYRLFIQDTKGSYKFSQWYEIADNYSSFPEAVCTGSECTVTVDASFADSTYTWWVRGWNDSGSGEWSDGMSFTVHTQAGIPAKIGLLSPSGTLAGTAAAFTWKPDAAASWYRLFVQNQAGTFKFSQWYETADNSPGFPETACTVSECTVTLEESLGDDTYTWWVRGWNEDGNGEWSDGMQFVVEDAAPF